MADTTNDVTVVAKNSTIIDDSLSRAIDSVFDAASCALKKGLITALEYKDIIDNFKLTNTVYLDPETGSNQNIIATEPSLFIQLAKVNVLCNGGATGTAAATVSGGTAPYTYLWDTPGAPTTASASNIPAGAYTLIVTDASSKTRTIGFTITEPTAIVAVTSKQDEQTSGGNNGYINTAVSGGVAPYTYLWSNAATTKDINNLAPGNYTLAVTDANGCVLNVPTITINAF